MPRVNDHYLKLAGAYLFPEIARRVADFAEQNPTLASEIIRCGIGDVSEPLTPAVTTAMHEAIDELGDHATFRGYPPPTGYPFLRERIAQHDFRSRGAEIADDEIFVSDGSKGDCGSLLEILSAENRVALPDPVYPVYVDTNVMFGGTGSARPGGGYDGLVPLPCTPENGFVPSPPKERVDVAYLCFPNNPTGAVIDRDRLGEWIDWANANEAMIIFDAAYAEFVRDAEIPRSIFELPGSRTCAIETRSFSKHGGFTGVRCGYTVVPKELEGRSATGDRIRLHDLWTRRWSTRANGVSWPVQRGAAALYEEAGRRECRATVDHYLGNAAALAAGCRALGWSVYGGENAPYVWVACPDGLDSWSFFDRLLRKARIVTTPGVGFGASGDGFIRISAFNRRDAIEEVVGRLRTIA